MTGIDAIKKNGIPLRGTSAPQVLIRLLGLAGATGFAAELADSAAASGAVNMYTACSFLADATGKSAVAGFMPRCSQDTSAKVFLPFLSTQTCTSACAIPDKIARQRVRVIVFFMLSVAINE